MANIQSTLEERGTRYGKFINNATLAQLIKRHLWAHNGWDNLQPDQQEALDLIVSKIARIMSGDPSYADNWHDIAGYATLIVDRLEGAD